MPYLAIFEQGGSTDMFSLFTGGGRDDTSKSVIVTLSNLGGATAPSAPPARYGPGEYSILQESLHSVINSSTVFHEFQRCGGFVNFIQYSVFYISVNTVI